MNPIRRSIIPLLAAVMLVSACSAAEDRAATETAILVETQSAQGTATQVAENNQTATETAEAAATAVAQETQVAVTATAERHATSTARAVAQATRATALAATEQIEATAEAEQAAFNEALGNLVESPNDLTIAALREAAQPLEVEYGPESSEIRHDRADRSPEVDCPVVIVDDFVATVTFENPYSRNRGQWDIGMFFRATNEGSYRLTIEANGIWRFGRDTETSIVPITGGTLTNVNRDEGETNDIMLVAYEERGFFAVNGDFVQELDLSELDSPLGGLFCLGTGLFDGSEIDGESTGYRDLRVWRILR